jgi:hypothetical protein
VEQFKFMPAPITRPVAWLCVNLAGSADSLELDAYSASYAKVQSVTLSGAFQAGWNTVRLDTNGWANGTYFVKLRAWRGGDRSPSKTGKTVVLH